MQQAPAAPTLSLPEAARMGPPARCTCTTATATTLAATLACPLQWWPEPDATWGRIWRHLPGQVLGKLAGRPRTR